MFISQLLYDFSIVLGCDNPGKYLRNLSPDPSPTIMIRQQARMIVLSYYTQWEVETKPNRMVIKAFYKIDKFGLVSTSRDMPKIKSYAKLSLSWGLLKRCIYA